MPNQTNKIDVEVDLPNGETYDYKDVNYISFVTGETYGIPAIISERATKAEGLPVTVLYVNPTNIAAMKATRRS